MGRASFLLESVERGGWAQLVDGSRVAARHFEEAEALELLVVGYLAYDHIAALEPTVPLPTDGHGFPESRG